MKSKFFSHYCYTCEKSIENTLEVLDEHSNEIINTKLRPINLYNKPGSI